MNFAWETKGEWFREKFWVECTSMTVRELALGTAPSFWTVPASFAHGAHLLLVTVTFPLTQDHFCFRDTNCSLANHSSVWHFIGIYMLRMVHLHAAAPVWPPCFTGKRITALSHGALGYIFRKYRVKENNRPQSAHSSLVLMWIRGESHSEVAF